MPSDKKKKARMRLVIHAGPHKTGTSYIQQRFTDNRDFLRQSGWYYPVIGTMGMEGQHWIAYNNNFGLGPDAAINLELSEMAEICRHEGLNMVLSAEGFRTWDRDKLLGLADILGFETVELLYFVRDPYDMYRSYWGEEVKQGFGNSLPARMMASFVAPETSYLLNPMIDINRMSGSDRIRLTLIYYDALKAGGFDICDVITGEVLRLGVLPDKRKERINESFSIELTEFLRLLTLRQFKTKHHSGSAFRNRLFSQIPRAEIEQIEAAVNAHGQECFRSLTLSRETPFYENLRRELAAAKVYRHLPEAGYEGLPRDPAVWNFMDIGEIMNVPEIARIVLETEQRIKL